MAVIFIGSVQYNNENQKVTKMKNDVIFTQAFYEKKHPRTIAKEQTVLLTISKSLYEDLQNKIIGDIEEKSRDEIADLMKSDFFIELHLKDRKAKAFFEKLKPEFYFPG